MENNDGIHRFGPSTAFNGLPSSNSTWQWEITVIKDKPSVSLVDFHAMLLLRPCTTCTLRQSKYPNCKGPIYRMLYCTRLPLAISEGYKSHRHNEGWFMCIYIIVTYRFAAITYVHMYISYIYTLPGKIKPLTAGAMLRKGFCSSFEVYVILQGCISYVHIIIYYRLYNNIIYIIYIIYNII